MATRTSSGFQRAFEDAGGKVVQKIFTPLNAPDYGTYVSQFKNVDCLYTGHAGSNGLKLIRQLSEYGLKGKFTVVGGFTPIDESVLQQMGEDGVGCYSGCWYSAALDNPINKKFVATIQREYKVDPGVYAAETYLCGEVLEHALKTVSGKIEDKDAFMKALKEAKVPATLSRADQLRRARQRGQQHLHPQGREEGRQVRQHGREDLSERQPVLDLRQGRVPEEPGLLARLPAGEEFGVIVWHVWRSLLLSPLPERERVAERTQVREAGRGSACVTS